MKRLDGNHAGHGPGALTPGFSPGRYPIVLLIGLGSSIVWLIFLSQEGRSSLARWMSLRSNEVTLQGLVLHPFFHYGRARSSPAEVRPISRDGGRPSGNGAVIENAPARSPVTRRAANEDLLAVLHIGSCLFALVYAGRLLEARWGTARFGVFFVFVTLGAAGVSIAVAALRQTPCVIFGTGAAAMGSLAVASTICEDGVVLRIFRCRHLIWAGIGVFAMGMVILEKARFPIFGAEVSALPQITGIGFGLLFSTLLPIYDRTQLERELDRRRDIRARVDRLLAKISTEGYQSLTAEEKTFLEEASQHYRRRV